MSERKAVYTIAPRGEGKKDFWCRIGTCFTNRDGSLSIVLDALPLNNKLVVREEQPRDEQAPRQRQQGFAPRGRGGDDFGGSGGDDEVPF